MIKLPTYYIEGRNQIVYPYYGKFLLELTVRNRLDGMYGLTGAMLDEALWEWGGRLGDDTIDFDDEAKSTMFILRWS
jgi:hypothetical protein